MRVAIVHPWFPQYRKEFFELLLESGAERGIDIDIFHGETPPELASRNDSLEYDVAEKLPTRYLRLAGRYLGYKSLRPIRKKPMYDLLIMEQAVRNLETYSAIVRPVAKHTAYWGHGKTYTKNVSHVQERLKTILTLRAEWFFAYTEGGAKHVRDAGFPVDSITVVNNTIDSSSLQAAVDSVSEAEVNAFRNEVGLHGPTGLFVGGLDDSKRIEFLLSAAEKIRLVLPNFRLLVAGDGPDRWLIEKAMENNGAVRYLGPIFGSRKSMAMKAADVLMMPGRVGLVAVDSFATGTPIITTNWPWHAPEFEYLRDGYNAVVSDDSMDAYVSSAVRILKDPVKKRFLGENCRQDSTLYSSEAMVDRFLGGLDNFRLRYL